MTEILNNIDNLIKSGRGGKAALELKKIQATKLKVADRVTYAFLARRLSLPSLAIRLLNPIVRPEGRQKSEATIEEIIEYAASLIKIGALSEGLDLLRPISAKTHPETLLLQAFAEIQQWNYAQAIPLLKEHLRSENISPYKRLVGQANLCEALVHSQNPDATEMVEKTLTEAKAQGFVLVEGFVQMAQIELLLNLENWSEVEKVHAAAVTAMGCSDTTESFFLRKWGALIALHRDGANTKTLRGLEEIKKEALEKWKHWETVRDCDYYQAVWTNDERLMQHLYFGTPFEAFRSRLISRFPKTKLNDVYHWRLGDKPKKGSPLELFSGDGKLRLDLVQSGKLNLPLLKILSSDFYRPFRLATIASRLLPGEFFNPISTPTRMRGIVKRLRQWLEANKVDAVVEEIHGCYRLSSSGSIVLSLPNSEKPSDGAAPELDLFKNSWNHHDAFSVRDICRVLSVSPRSANRILKEGVDNGVLLREGKGKATCYRWKAASSEKLAA